MIILEEQDKMAFWYQMTDPCRIDKLKNDEGKNVIYYINAF